MERSDSLTGQTEVRSPNDVPAGCQSLHNLFETVWSEFLDPFFSAHQGTLASDAAEGIAYMQHRLKELVEGGPGGITCAISLLKYSMEESKKHTVHRRLSPDLFEQYLAGNLENGSRPQGAGETDR